MGMKLAPVHLPEKILIIKNGKKPGLFLFIFVRFTWQIKHNFYHKWKNRRWCAWDSNPVRQDGRCRRIHWAMAAQKINIFLCTGARRHRSRRPPPSPRGRADFPIRYLRPRLGSGRFGLSALRTAGNWSSRDQRGQRLRNPNSNNIISSDILGIVMLCLIHICCWYTMRIPTCFANTYWEHLPFESIT